MTPAPIDMDELNVIMNSDTALIKECFNDFTLDYPGIMEQLKGAVDTGDFDSIDDAAHKLKGILSYLAAGSAVKAAAAVEQAGKNQLSDGLPEKAALLEAQCSMVLDFIDNFQG